MTNLSSPNPLLYEALLRTAFAEDLGLAGDLTTEATVPNGTVGSAKLVARSAGVVAGLDVAARAFTLYDQSLGVTLSASDGDRVVPGQSLATVEGSARSILTAERTALNLLGRMCGIASSTAAVVAAIAATGAHVVDTRKTTPGLRVLEKYAVRAGGGANHRFGLDDAVLVKDNHIALAGGLPKAMSGVRERVGHLVKIEVEVDNLDQLDELLAIGADVVLLDNFSLADLREAVRRVNGVMLTEASGGITPQTATAIAETGVDLLSIGWLTHSAAVLDIGLDVLP